ncbi:MAG TPA: glycosyltransferase family 2 protein, partial [Flavobacteriales bacterium]|nr:glycosyltransferase family 2 protein [Flavobacteriales bacterium]HRD51078.1 glycosyltransferase family 2 protein [Flavobacteriales bacterium]
MSDTVAQRIVLVMPCYNEAGRLPVQRIKDTLNAHPWLSLVLVDDGSTDGTAAVLGRLSESFPDRVQVLVLARNGGKGEAVRQGMLMAAGLFPGTRYAGFFDADLATPLEEALHLRESAGSGHPALIMGSRVNLMGTTRIQRSSARHYIGRLFSTMVSEMLKLPVYDSQCGAKLVRMDRVQQLFGEPFLTRWLFDVELIWRVVNLVGRERAHMEIAEVPVRTWLEQGG